MQEWRICLHKYTQCHIAHKIWWIVSDQEHHSSCWYVISSASHLNDVGADKIGGHTNSPVVFPPPHHTHMMGAESTSDIQWLPGFLLTKNESSITRRDLFVLISFVAQTWRWAVSEAFGNSTMHVSPSLVPRPSHVFQRWKVWDGLGTRLTEHYIINTP